MAKLLRLAILLVSIYFIIDEVTAQLPPSIMLPKRGSCPPPLPRQICHNSCEEDSECSGSERCCSTSCGGRVCSRTVTARLNPHIVKKGTCPTIPNGPWFCSNTCWSDGDCRGNKKCCRNKCGGRGCYLPLEDISIQS